MKRITGLTEEMAGVIAAAAVTYRAVRAVNVVRERGNDEKVKYPYLFAVEIETYSAEENTGMVLDGLLRAVQNLLLTLECEPVPQGIGNIRAAAGEVRDELNQNLTSRGSGKDCAAGAQ